MERNLAADNIWMTCCALHNMLLFADGLADEWQGELGNNDREELEKHAPFALRRLANPELFGSREHERECAQRRVTTNRSTRLFDPEENSADEDQGDNEEEFLEQMDEVGATFVNSLSYFEFRNRLVAHFDILHRQHKICWPERRSPNDSNNNNNNS